VPGIQAFEAGAAVESGSAKEFSVRENVPQHFSDAVGDRTFS
jgi:hypothetical protein